MIFLKNIISSAIGFIMAIGLFFVFVLIIGIAIGVDEGVETDGMSVLKIELNTALKDYAPLDTNPFSELLGLSPKYVGLNKIIEAIEKAKNDYRIKGISIEPISMDGGISQLNSVRNAIIDFKTSGKFVMAYSDAYGQKEYFLSSVADSVFVNPVGQVDFKGLSSEVLFFKDFQDKYGVKMEVIRHGKYKSAVEPFLENKMSASNRTQMKELLNSLWVDITDAISISRDVPLKDLNKIADNLLGRTANLSVSNNLVDAAIYKDEYKLKLRNLLNGIGYKSVSLLDYIQSNRVLDYEIDSEINKIAVVYAQGNIIYGEGDEETIGQGMIVKAIENAKKDTSVKAIVLRVNSPGGSALASDLIWRALELAKKEKPLVVSMGNYAASGGYYISCNADRIFAESTTITGSIGVFGMFPNASELTSNMGIYSERVSTNKSPSYSPFLKLDPAFYEVTKEGVDVVYKTFVAKVAKGRNMSFDAVHKLAQGRVWSGKQAMENGLIDALGGLDSAINSAVSLAEIEEYKIKNYPDYNKDIRDSFQNMPFVNIKDDLMKEWMGNASFILFKQLHNLKNSKGIQMAMPYVLDIK
jgi:protease-4